jgi:hypothetical protein
MQPVLDDSRGTGPLAAPVVVAQEKGRYKAA